MKNLILLSYGLVDIPNRSQEIINHIQHSTHPSQSIAYGTLLNNIVYYGYMPDSTLLSSLQSMTEPQLRDWWQIWKVEFDAITGNDKNMDQFVVYRNFPSEVLNLSEAHYWINQILIYLGVDANLIVDIEKERAPLNEQFSKLKKLSVAPKDILENIYLNLNMPSI